MRAIPALIGDAVRDALDRAICAHGIAYAEASDAAEAANVSLDLGYAAADRDAVSAAYLVFTARLSELGFAVA